MISETARAARVVLVWSIGAIVGIVPLLLDVGNLANTYYAAKARALYILVPLVVISLTLLGQMRRRWADPGIVVPGLLFVAFVSAATIMGVDPNWSVLGAPWRNEGLLTLITYPVILLGTLALVRLGYLRLWTFLTLGAGTIVAAYGVAQYLGYEWLVRDGLRVGWWEAFSTTGHMNYLGGYMVLLLPLAVASVVTARRGIGLVSSVASVLTMYLSLLFTFSRAAWAAAALGFVALTVALALTRRIDRRYSLVIGTLAVITVVFFIPRGPLGPRPAWAMRPLARAQSVLALDTPSVQVRPYIWRVTVPLLLQRPILGYGPEALTLVFPKVPDQERRYYLGPFPKRIDKAHNDTLDVAMSTGVLGLAVYWWLLVASIRRGWTAFRSSSPNGMLALGTVVGLLAFWFDLQFGFSTVSVAPVYWSVMGAAAGLGASLTERRDNAAQ